MNLELIKLLSIIIGGIVIMVVGVLIQSKTKKKKEEVQPTWTPNNSDEFHENPTIKNYIESYKSQFSKESIKSALLNNNFKEEEIDKHLEKFF